MYFEFMEQFERKEPLLTNETVGSKLEGGRALHGVTGLRISDPETTRALEQMYQKCTLGISIGAALLVGGWLVYDNLIRNLPRG